MTPIPCPSCGKEPRIEYSSFRPDGLAWVAECGDDYGSHLWYYARTEKVAVQGWNKLVRDMNEASTKVVPR